MADTKISALTASTTPLAGTEVLPIVQGGVTKQVSVTNLTAGRPVDASNLTITSSQVYARSNIIGTVSQSAGVPTGGIIESGTNANGFYVKYADGTMLCGKSSSGSGYGSTGSKTEAWTYPATFASLLSISFNVVEPDTTTGRWNILYVTTSGTNSNVTHVVNVTTAFTNAPQIRYFAFGRWY